MSVLLRVCCHTDSLWQQQQEEEEQEEELHAGFQRRSTTTWTQNRVRNTGSALQAEKSPQSDTKTPEFYRTNRKLETRRAESAQESLELSAQVETQEEEFKPPGGFRHSPLLRVGPSGCCSASLRFSALGSSRPTSLFGEQEERPRRGLVSPPDGSKVHTHAAAFTELRAAQWKAEPRAVNAARRTVKWMSCVNENDFPLHTTAGHLCLFHYDEPRMFAHFL